MSTGDPDPFAVPPEHGEIPDDPFARAAEAADGGEARPEPSAPTPGTLALRDPDAPVEVSGEFRTPGAVSVEDLFRQARRRGFIAGAAVGAAAALVVAGTITWKV